jgi:hypothetical protein
VAPLPQPASRIFAPAAKLQNPIARSVSASPPGRIVEPVTCRSGLVSQGDGLVGEKHGSSTSPAFGGDPDKGEAGEAFASPLLVFKDTLGSGHFAGCQLLGNQNLSAVSAGRQVYFEIALHIGKSDLDHLKLTPAGSATPPGTVVRQTHFMTPTIFMR